LGVPTPPISRIRPRLNLLKLSDNGTPCRSRTTRKAKQGRTGDNPPAEPIALLTKQKVTAVTAKAKR